MSETTFNSNRKIDEALQLLNEAAKEKKDELRRLLGEKYSSIKEALTEVALNNKEVLGNVRRLAQDSIEEGQERFTETVETIDTEVRKNPWPYIGGAAAVALLLGFVLGNSKR
ncbi:MAG TPA: DUF883 domain-containing protein [Candidatus Eisenbacteria bacterium]|jgi:ElaB/YqjD/DUF883 family membrane-anchored ribosome-binding protein|nr:DUF883 domain-containing protein [Candidatus Eisenbacteria bacterium]